MHALTDDMKQIAENLVQQTSLIVDNTVQVAEERARDNLERSQVCRELERCKSEKMLAEGEGLLANEKLQTLSTHHDNLKIELQRANLGVDSTQAEIETLRRDSQTQKDELKCLSERETQWKLLINKSAVPHSTRPHLTHARRKSKN